LKKIKRRPFNGLGNTWKVIQPAIADKLTGPYKPHEYGEVVLPLQLSAVLTSSLKKQKKQ
jgi:hypothetical protein